MSYLRVQTTIKKPGKDPKRKNARKEMKVYQYVYEITSRRGRIKAAQEKTKMRKYKAIVHDVKKRLGPYMKVDQVKQNKFSIIKSMGLEKNDLLKEVLRYNLLAHGFTKKSNDVFECPGAIINLQELSVIDPQKSEDIVLGIHGGFVCSTTLKRMFEFEMHYKEDMKTLAKYVRDLGLMPLEVPELPEERDYNPKHLKGIINTMSKMLGEEEEGDIQLKMLVENHKLFMATLAKKSPLYRKMKEEEKKANLRAEEERSRNSMSLDDFKRKEGY